MTRRRRNRHTWPERFTRPKRWDETHRDITIRGRPKIIGPVQPGAPVAVLPHLWGELRSDNGDGTFDVRCTVDDIETAIAQMDYDAAQITRSVFDVPAPWVNEGVSDEDE